MTAKMNGTRRGSKSGVSRESGERTGPVGDPLNAVEVAGEGGGADEFQ